MQVCQFHSIYGAAAYRNSGYPTEDGCIPFKLFFAMMSCLSNVKAYEIINNIEAIGLGYATVKSDKKNQQKILKEIRKKIRQADGME